MQITAPMGIAFAQPAETARADVKNIVRKHRQYRHRAAEQHGEHIQRDDAEDDFALIDKPETFDQIFDRNGFSRFGLVDVFDRRNEREAGDRSQGVQRINRPCRAMFRIRVRRHRDDRAERRRPKDARQLKRAAVERDRARRIGSAARGWSQTPRWPATKKSAPRRGRTRQM